VAFASIVLLGAFLVIFSLRLYRHNNQFRSDIKWNLFAVTAFGADHKLLLLGDSRIESLTCAQDIVGWRVLNLGVSGIGSEGVATYVAPRLHNLVSFDAIVLWVGVNDIARKWQATDVASRVTSLLQQLKRARARIGVIEQIYILNRAQDPEIDRANRELTALNEMLARRVDPNRISILKPFGTMPIDSFSKLYSDNLHLNEQGNKVLCEGISRWLIE